MVIFIGGQSCSGKTTMAQRLLEKHYINYLSIDHVKMGIIRSYEKCGFTAEDSEDKITKHIWPCIKEIAKTNIENYQNIIIEGCYIPTDDVNNFESNYQEYIISLYIVFSRQYIEKHFEDGIIKHRSETEYKDVDDYMNKEFFIKEHEIQKEKCIANGQKYFEVFDNYEEDLKCAYDWIAKKISEKKLLKMN